MVHLWFWIFKFPCPVGLIFSLEIISGRFFSNRGRRQHRQLGAGARVPAVPGPPSLPGAGVSAPAGSRCGPGDPGQTWGSPRGCRHLPPVRRVQTVGRPGHFATSDFLSQVRPAFHMEHIPPGQSLHQYQVLMGNISSVLLEGFLKTIMQQGYYSVSPSLDINDFTPTFNFTSLARLHHNIKNCKTPGQNWEICKHIQYLPECVDGSLWRKSCFSVLLWTRPPLPWPACELSPQWWRLEDPWLQPAAKEISAESADSLTRAELVFTRPQRRARVFSPSLALPATTS